jgi:hypothetical protein
MFVSDRSRLLSLVLIPVLVGFSFQGALEVFHPVEEDLPRGHRHLTDGPTFGDIAECGAGNAHPSHYCPHSGALAGIAKGPVALRPIPHRNPALSGLVSPARRHASGVRGRGPPIHG